MFSYRHGFHAGNFADVLKHVVLVALLDALARKSTPFAVLDTHAGAGLYDLRDDMALKRREYEHGLHRLWWRDDLPAPVARWRDRVRAADPTLAPGAPPRCYPGSPVLVRGLLREADRLLLSELHPAEQRELRQRFRGDAQAQVHARDGYEAMTALLPPAERRGLVLVDPSYETADEIANITGALQRALQRWPGGIYAVWYPLLARKSVRRLLEWPRKAGARRVLQVELRVRPDGSPAGMHGCGMLVLNAPWQLDRMLADTPAWLARALAEGEAASGSVRWLVPDEA